MAGTMQDKHLEADTSAVTEAPSAQEVWRSRAILAAIIVVALLLLAAAILAIIAMLGDPVGTQTIRDIVIVFMAVESLVIGVALIVLIVQLARLTALLQDEIRPMLDATYETLGTLRGTTRFLSDKLVDPVVKASSSVAAAKRALDFFRPSRPK